MDPLLEFSFFLNPPKPEYVSTFKVKVAIKLFLQSALVFYFLGVLKIYKRPLGQLQ